MLRVMASHGRILGASADQILIFKWRRSSQRRSVGKGGVSSDPVAYPVVSLVGTLQSPGGH